MSPVTVRQNAETMLSNEGTYMCVVNSVTHTWL